MPARQQPGPPSKFTHPKRIEMHILQHPRITQSPLAHRSVDFSQRFLSRADVPSSSELPTRLDPLSLSLRRLSSSPSKLDPVTVLMEAAFRGVTGRRGSGMLTFRACRREGSRERLLLTEPVLTRGILFFLFMSVARLSLLSERAIGFWYRRTTRYSMPVRSRSLPTLGSRLAPPSYPGPPTPMRGVVMPPPTGPVCPGSIAELARWRLSFCWIRDVSAG